MKNLFIVAFSLITLNTFACSISVNELASKNQLIAKTASEFNIDLTKASKISIQDFSYRMYGEVPNSTCERFYEESAEITIKYKPNLLTQCELKVDVVLTIDGQLNHVNENLEFLAPTSSCTLLPIGRIPRRSIKN